MPKSKKSELQISEKLLSQFRGATPSFHIWSIPKSETQELENLSVSDANIYDDFLLL